MNLIKIGKLIADSRKKENLTQMQLAEKLNITDRAVSKWETGRALPDSAIMLELCSILKISVNELLLGEKIIMEKNNQKSEQLLFEMAKEIEQKNKTVWTNMWIIMIVSMVGLLSSVFLATFLMEEGVWQLVVIIGAVIVFLIPCCYALKLEVSVGAYKCKKCGTEVVPTYMEALNAMHMGFTRYLKCPKCGKHNWCKKIIKK